MSVRVDHIVFISAHRGHCGTPGLPIAESYQRAIDLNVDYVEFDVRRTKDGTYVIWHDEHTPSKRRVCRFQDCLRRTGVPLICLCAEIEATQKVLAELK